MFTFMRERIGFRGDPLRELADHAADELYLLYGKDPFRPAPSDSISYAVDQGMVTGLIVWRDWEAQKAIWMGLSWTMPNYRGRGIYSRLVTDLKKIAEERNFTSLQCSIAYQNRRSIAVHQALGMRPTLFELTI